MNKEWELVIVGDFINSDLLSLKIASNWTCLVTFYYAASELLFNICNTFPCKKPKLASHPHLMSSCYQIYLKGFALLLGDLLGIQLRCADGFEVAASSYVCQSTTGRIHILCEVWQHGLCLTHNLTQIICV